MEKIERDFTLLTACFAHGAYQSQDINRPELRPASVKGQVRWWYDKLNPPSYVAKTRASDPLFGRVGKDSQAGRVSIRLVERDVGSIEKTDFMPHKGRKGGAKNAIPAGSSYTLHISERREGLTEGQEASLKDAVDAWLLLGGIGQRSNRAAGSVWPDDAPQTAVDFILKAGKLSEGGHCSPVLLPALDPGLNEREIRHICGDFLASTAFSSCQEPFGRIKPKRKPSNLKLKAVKLDGELGIVAVWDKQEQATSNLIEGIKILKNHSNPRRIADLLDSVQDQF